MAMEFDVRAARFEDPRFGYPGFDPEFPVRFHGVRVGDPTCLLCKEQLTVAELMAGIVKAYGRVNGDSRYGYHLVHNLCAVMVEQP